jgi:hypothetical protein
MISTLQKLTGLGSDIVQSASSSSINFNANLPVTITVLKKIDPLRYRLKVGRKELTTKSQKALEISKRYWANFDENKGGILTISQMWPQPEAFQNEALFPVEDFSFFFDQKDFSYDDFRTFLMKKLSDETVSKELFQSYTPMLLALSKQIVHLPLIHNDKKILLQFQAIGKDTVMFYIAMENLGPIQGRLDQNSLNLAVMYEKSLYYLQKEQAKLGMITRFSLQKEIHPLFDRSDMIFDVKG